ncbi:MAG: metal ABC transporter permease [Candidatus Roizmanbacteria bacterium]
MDFIQAVIQYEFLQRAIISGVCLGMLYVWLGLFTYMKKMSFYADGIAHASLLGFALGWYFKQSDFLTSILSAIIFGCLVYILERRTRIGNDTLISILFTGGMALGIMVLYLLPGYKPDLLAYLFGNILTITQIDYIGISLFSIVTIALGIWHRDKLTLVFYDPIEAKLKKINVEIYEFLFYIVLSVSIILGVRLMGVVLISAMLILPTFISMLLCSNLKQVIISSSIIILLIVTIGIYISYSLNLPTGPSVVIVGLVLVLLSLVKQKLS